jgi:hypothetical protein
MSWCGQCTLEQHFVGVPLKHTFTCANVHTLSDKGVSNETDWASRRLSLTSAGETAAYVCLMAIEILDRVVLTSPEANVGRPLTTSGGGNALASIKGGAVEASLADIFPLAVV